jgi:hypothetical protein
MPIAYTMNLKKWGLPVKFKVGDKVIFEGKILTVLGFAASTDEDGVPFVEIAWDDYELSPISGYLGVSQKELSLANEANQ